MSSILRRQLTIFVDPVYAESIERVRQTFNPAQFELIKSHVTLCREDELKDLEVVISNLKKLKKIKIVIDFGKVERSADGKGVLLPGTGINNGFHELRKQVLQGLNVDQQRPDPHITLMHPRNSTCTDQIFEEIQKIEFPTQLEFHHIALIEQKEGGAWKVLRGW